MDNPEAYDPPLSAPYGYEYDRDKRLTRMVYPSGVDMDFAYTNGKLELITLPGAEGTVDLVYGDGACQEKLTSIEMSNGESVDLTYDGPVLTGVTTDGVLDATLSVGYLETSTNKDFTPDSFTYAGGTTNLTYDNDGLLTGAGGYSIARESKTGLPDSIGDGTLSVLPVFNGYGEVTTNTYKIGGSTKASVGLTYAPYTGEISAKTEMVAGTTTTYGYDYTDLGQLEDVTKNSTVVEEYKYDDQEDSPSNYGNGNRTYQNLYGTEWWFSYDAEDRLDGIFSNSNHSTQLFNYNYDTDGFLTQKIETGGPTTTYDYNSQGQLLEVAFSTGTTQGVRYKYDALGRRVQKETKTGGTWTVQEKYLWAGMNQGLLAVYNASDALIMRFEYAGGRLPMAMTYGGNKYYLAYDQVGSLRAVFDTSGTNVREITYDSFGNILLDSGSLSLTMPIGFAGGLYDRHTGLVLFGHRDYDPRVGRWTAKDPIGFAGGDVNLYGYVLGNPVLFVDPQGLKFGWNVIGAWFGGLAEGAGEGLAIVGDALNPFEDYWADNGYYDKCTTVNQFAGAAAFVGGEATWGVAGGGLARGIQAIARNARGIGQESILFAQRYRSRPAGLLNGGASWGGRLRLGWSYYPGMGNRFAIHGGKPHSLGHYHFYIDDLAAAGSSAYHLDEHTDNRNEGCQCP